MVSGLPIIFTPTQIGQISEPQSLAVEGLALNGNMNITTQNPFQISLTTSGDWSTSLSLVPNGEGNIPVQDIWVRFTPTDAVDYLSNIVVTSDNAIEISGQLEGDGIDFPSFSAIVAGDFTHESAWLHAMVEDNNSQLTARGFSYSKNSDMSDSLYVLYHDDFPEGEMSYQITGLETRTMYYYQPGRKLSRQRCF